MALAKKQSERVNSWIEGKVDNFFIRVDPSYKTCEFKYSWIPPVEPPKVE
jgi:uncharacterized protein YmfQ (DUF2313 family)